MTSELRLQKLAKLAEASKWVEDRVDYYKVLWAVVDQFALINKKGEVIDFVKIRGHGEERVPVGNFVSLIDRRIRYLFADMQKNK